MFFRREKPRTFTFDDRVQMLKEAGFTIQSLGSGKVRATKYGCGAVLEDQSGSAPNIGKAGILVGDSIAHLVHGGYQMFLRTEDGRKLPAQAHQLRALHDFEEDLKEGLGMISLYNQSLGTRCDEHLYDRVEDRDHGGHLQPWEKRPATP
jgi:hypothetical protein